MRLRVKRSPWADGLAALLLIAVAVLAMPAGAQETFTDSTSSHTTFNDSSRTETLDTFLTRITARFDGSATLLFDQSFGLPFGDAAVQAAVVAAQAALNGAIDPDPTIVGPTLLSFLVSPIDSDLMTIETPAGSQVTPTVEITIGPGVAITGNRDTGGVPFIVLAGTTNFNTNVHTEFFVDRLFLTTETFLTTAHYELVGFAQVAAVPEPGSLGLLAVGLASAAFWRPTGRQIQHRRA
jgi:hypothetical protein